MEDRNHVWFQSAAVAQAAADALGGQYLGGAVSQGVWHVAQLPPALADQVRRVRLPYYGGVSLTVAALLAVIKQHGAGGASPSSGGGSLPPGLGGRVVPFVRPSGRG